MSSISSSDRAQQQDDVRRIRDEYEEREIQNARKKNKEIKNLHERHEKDLTEIRENYERQLDAIRGKHRELLDERDEKHANDAKKIRQLFLDSIQRRKVEGEHEKSAIVDAYETELEKSKEIKDQQVENMQRNFKDGLRERDRKLEEFVENSNHQMRQSLGHTSDNLKKKHDIELNTIRSERDAANLALNQKTEEIKSQYDEDLGRLRKLQNRENNRRELATVMAVRTMEDAHTRLLENRDEQLKNSRDRMQQNYNLKFEEMRDKMGKIANEYEGQLEGRISGVIQKAKLEASEAENKRNIDRITNRRLRDLERENLQRDYEAKYKDLEGQKNEAFEAANSLAHERVLKVKEENDKINTYASRRHKMDQNVENMRNRHAINSQEIFHKDQIDLMRTQTEDRVRKVLRDTTNAQKTLTRQTDDEKDQLKGMYMQNLQNQRDMQLEELKNIHGNMGHKFRQLELQMNKKYEDAVDFYKTQLEELKADARREMKRQNEIFQLREKQSKKANKQELEGLEVKYKQKIAELDEIHQKELERVEKRYQEQMQDYMARASTRSINGRKA